VPGDDLAYRTTAFHNTAADPNDLPNPDTSGGDVSGLGVDEPLVAVDTTPIASNGVDSLPPHVDGTTARVELTEPEEAHIARVLVEEFEQRADAALATGDPDAALGLLLPGLLTAPNGEACRQTVEATLALADSIDLTNVPTEPIVAGNRAAYQAVANLNYPNGPVEFAPLLAPGPAGRLYLVLGECL
jgi:hypothetical protein